MLGKVPTAFRYGLPAALATLFGSAFVQAQDVHTTIQENRVNINRTVQYDDSNDNATYQTGKVNINRTVQCGDSNDNATYQTGKVNINRTVQCGDSNDNATYQTGKININRTIQGDGTNRNEAGQAGSKNRGKTRTSSSFEHTDFKTSAGSHGDFKYDGSRPQQVRWRRPTR